MKNNALQYTFRVWITSILVSPVLFALILIIRQVLGISELLDNGVRLIGLYLLLVAAQLLFSFVTWLVFLLLVKLVCRLNSPKPVTTLAIFGIGIALTVGTFMALNGLIDFTSDNTFENLVYSNCATIGWGIWYYRLDIEPKEQIASIEKTRQDSII